MTTSRIRVRLVQMDVFPGCPARNTFRMLEEISDAHKDGVDLLVFPEMAIPGYLLGDEWEHEAFLRECEECGREIVKAAKDVIVVFGNVAIDWAKRNEDGRVLKYNALFVAEHGALCPPEHGPGSFVPKTLLPNYREFDDSRHFFGLRQLALELDCSPADLLRPVATTRLRIGSMLCEDAWDLDYAVSPLRVLASSSPDLIINISASPFTLNKNHKRNRVFSSHAEELEVPLLYVNNVGIQNNGKTVFTFDGRSCIWDTHGNRWSDAQPFEDTQLTLDMPMTDAPFGDPPDLTEDTVSDIHHAVSYGTRKFMRQCRVGPVVVGVSGGIDSSLVAALYSRIVESPQSLILVNMPGAHTSATTQGIADRLARNLDCPYLTVPIADSVDVTRRQIEGLALRNASGSVDTTLSFHPSVLENIQARDRSSRILAAVASAVGGVFTCNANKSEATVGYTTLYGDLAGYLASIADLWKGEVYALARYMNAEVFQQTVIPEEAFSIVPSAELSPDQAVEQGKGDPLRYAYHDRLFESWVEWWNRASPEDILTWYAEGTLEQKLRYDGNLGDLFPDAAALIEDMERWWDAYQGLGVAKRIQAPPVLAIKRRAFGFDHRESQLGPRYTRRYVELKNSLLRPGNAESADPRE